MTKKKVEAKVKAVGTLTVENDARGKVYAKPVGEIVEEKIAEREAEEFIAAEAEFDEKAQSEVAEKIAEAEAEIVEIVAEETAIYQKAMKGKHIAELFSEE